MYDRAVRDRAVHGRAVHDRAVHDRALAKVPVMSVRELFDFVTDIGIKEDAVRQQQRSNTHWGWGPILGLAYLHLQCTHMGVHRTYGKTSKRTRIDGRSCGVGRLATGGRLPRRHPGQGQAAQLRGGWAREQHTPVRRHAMPGILPQPAMQKGV